MSSFALVFEGSIVQIDAATFPVAPALVWTTDISAVTPAPQVGWTASETGSAWTFAAPVVPPPTNEQLAATELAAKTAEGIAITSASLPAVNATYALDTVSTAQIFQIGLYASQFGVFPSGGTNQEYPDATGVPHSFTVPVFVAFLRAVAPLVSALETQAGILAQGGTPTWPTQTAAIA
jgi:hypothetical protein